MLQANTPNPATQQNEISSRGRREMSGFKVVLNTEHFLSNIMEIINTVLFLVASCEEAHVSDMEF